MQGIHFFVDTLYLQSPPNPPLVHSAGSAYATVYGGPQQRTKLEDMFEAPRSPRHKVKHGRSNSWTDATAEETSLSPTLSEGNRSKEVASKALEIRHGEARWGMLEEGEWGSYSRALAAYSDALYNWGLLEQRASVRKHSPSVREEGVRAVVSSTCPTCGVHLEQAGCTRCRAPCLHCAVCRLPVVGLGVVCPACGHGGHLAHLATWLSSHPTCPASCGCSCQKFL